MSRELEAWPGCWAICGGIAASLYRTEPRFTGDVDIALIDQQQASARSIAEGVLQTLGCTPSVGFIPQEDGRLSERPALVIGRNEAEDRYTSIDFLLPFNRWVPSAVSRAQHNLLDYGFATLPTISPEDMLIAKSLAVTNSPDRPYDLDDIKSIVENMESLDIAYLRRQFHELQVQIPQALQEKLD